jgi:SAM-dependent methyltransferase
MTQPYVSLEATLHDAFWAAEEGAPELPLMLAFLRQHPGPALEIGCGSGRLLLPLVRAGFAVEGLELSRDMLALCRQSAEEEKLPVTLHEGDMSSWTPAFCFSALLVPAFTLQLASDPETALRHWHGLLRKEGGLYLSTFVPLAELEGDLPENEWYLDREIALADGGPATLETRHRLDVRRQLLHREHRYRLDDLQHVSTQTLRWFEDGELEETLGRCGFQVTAAFADFDPALPLERIRPFETDGIRTHVAVRRG